jgi:hypothetical protein
MFCSIMFKLIVCTELGSNASVFPQNTIPNGIMGLECQLPRKKRKCNAE